MRTLLRTFIPRERSGWWVSAARGGMGAAEELGVSSRSLAERPHTALSHMLVHHDESHLLSNLSGALSAGHDVCHIAGPGVAHAVFWGGGVASAIDPLGLSRIQLRRVWQVSERACDDQPASAIGCVLRRPACADEKWSGSAPSPAGFRSGPMHSGVGAAPALSGGWCGVCACARTPCCRNIPLPPQISPAQARC